MKIGGKDLVRERERILIRRRNGEQIEIMIQTIPVGFAPALVREMPLPRAPETIPRDHHGDPLRDKEGKPQKIVDYEDPKYQADVREYNTLAAIALIYAGTVPGTASVEWETRREDHADGKAFYRALLSEIISAGFSEGECGTWIREIKALSNMSAEEVEDAKGSFPV